MKKGMLKPRPTKHGKVKNKKQVLSLYDEESESSSPGANSESSNIDSMISRLENERVKEDNLNPV